MCTYIYIYIFLFIYSFVISCCPDLFRRGQTITLLLLLLYDYPTITLLLLYYCITLLLLPPPLVYFLLSSGRLWASLWARTSHTYRTKPLIISFLCVLV